MVFVVDKHGKPLMPTTRYRHVRILLKNHLAVPISNLPFTIKLKYDVEGITQKLYLGIDPGRENIGIGVSNEKGECIFANEVQTNNKSIKKNMDERRDHRQARRRNRRLRKQRKAIRDNTQFSKDKTIKEDTLRTTKSCVSKEYLHSGFDEPVTHKCIRGKEPRFNNRRRPEGWLTPSARQLIQVHFRSIESVLSILPITNIVFERNVFDFQKLENVNIKKWQYSKGPLLGFKGYKEFIYELQHGRCLLCGGKINNYHHIVPKSKKGSNTVKNIAGLCDSCHNGPDGVHKNTETAETLKNKKAGLRQKYIVSLLNTVMPELVKQITEFCEKKDISFSTTTGYETYEKRNNFNLPKQHYVDGYMISLAGKEVENLNIKLPKVVYKQRRFKKKSSANIQKLNQREYYKVEDGKQILIAKNRHKAEAQEFDSLEEYKNKYLESHTKEELEIHLRTLVVKPAKRTYTAHKYNLTSTIHVGDIVKYEKKNKIKGNTKMLVFLATGVSILSNKIEHGTKNKKISYCKSLKKRCLSYIEQKPI